MTQPTSVQLDALVAYAREHGRNWKAKLLDDWAQARTVGPLQEVRNQFGPTWLVTRGQKAMERRRFREALYRLHGGGDDRT